MRKVTAHTHLRPAQAFFFAAFPKATAVVVLLMVSMLPAAGEEEAFTLPLLAAPINATWAANNAEEWHEKGFRGFLFEGILDDLRLFPTEQERVQRFTKLHKETLAASEENTAVIITDLSNSDHDMGHMVVPGDWNELTEEISGANNRLRAAGVDRNFLHIRLAPEEAWFTDPILQEIAEQRFQLAGQVCRAANLRGIAVNTQSDSFIYDYRWDGYGRDLVPEMLAADAYHFGTRVLRAFIRECPGGEIMVIARDVESAGPLWFDLAEGMFDAPGAAEDIPVRMAVLEPPDIRDRDFFKRYPAYLTGLLKARRSRNLRQPRRDAGIIFALEPIHYEGDIPTARYPLKEYRPALYAAAVYSTAYILIWSPEGGWWQLPADMAEQYRHLKQGGAARVRFAPPVPRTLSAYAPFLYKDMGTRIGSIEILGQEAEVLKNSRGASLLFWEDTWDPLRLHARAGIVTAINLMAEERLYFTPKEGHVIIPPLSGPVLLEGIPLNEYALPTALQMHLVSPIKAGIIQSPVEIGITNPLPVPLQGTLAVLAGSDYALGAASFPLDLPPGQSVSFNRVLRGLSNLGTRPEFEVSLAITREAPITRNFVFPVTPEERFAFFCDGMVPGPLAVCPVPESGKPPLLLCCDVRGRLTCYDTGTHAIRWNRRVSGSYTRPPLLLKNADGDVRTGMVSLQGRLSLFNLNGEEKVVLLNKTKHASLPAALTTTEENTSDLLVIADDEQLSLYDIHGNLIHKIKTPGTAHYLLTDPIQPDLFFLVTSGENASPESTVTETSKGTNNSLLTAFDSGGRKIWEAPFSAGISCAPVIIADIAGSSPGICLGDAKGGITCLNTRDGTVIGRTADEKKNIPVVQMAGATPAPGGVAWIFCLAEDTLKALPAAPDTVQSKRPDLWTIKLYRPTSLAALPHGEGVVVGTADGGVYALNVSGGLLWEDHNSPGAVTGLTFFNDPAIPGNYSCIVSTAGHAVRCLYIRRDLQPKLPSRQEYLAAPSNLPRTAPN